MAPRDICEAAPPAWLQGRRQRARPLWGRLHHYARPSARSRSGLGSGATSTADDPLRLWPLLGWRPLLGAAAHRGRIRGMVPRRRGRAPLRALCQPQRSADSRPHRGTLVPRDAQPRLRGVRGGGADLSARADGGPRMRRGPRSARHEASQCRGRPSPRCRPQAAYPGTLAQWGPTGRHPCKGLGGPGGSPPCTCRGAHAHTTAPPRCGGWSTRSSRSLRPGVVPVQPAAPPADRAAGSAARAARAPAVAASPRRCGGGQFPPGPRPVAAEPRPAGGSAHQPAAAPQWAEVWAGSPRAGCGSAGDGGALLAGQGQPVGWPEPRLQRAVQRQGRDERTPRRH